MSEPVCDQFVPPPNWRTGLEAVGSCPHCGAPVFVRPADDDRGASGLPKPVYICVCRHPQPTPAAHFTAPPVVPTWDFSEPATPPPAVPYRTFPPVVYGEAGRLSAVGVQMERLRASVLSRDSQITAGAAPYCDSSDHAAGGNLDAPAGARSELQVKLDGFNHPG